MHKVQVTIIILPREDEHKNDRRMEKKCRSLGFCFKPKPEFKSFFSEKNKKPEERMKFKRER